MTVIYYQFEIHYSSAWTSYLLKLVINSSLLLVLVVKS